MGDFVEFLRRVRHKHGMVLTDDQRLARVIVPRLDKPVVLVGMMGSGKSRLGRMLGEVLELPFTDSDDEIVKAAGCSISDIFERYGEPFFRDRERKVIARLLDQESCVIATGGGALMQPETAALVKEKSISIWVRAELPILLERTGRGSARPLLKQGDPAETLTKLLAAREPQYRQADITVDSHGGPPSVILSEALRRLDAYLGARAEREAAS